MCGDPTATGKLISSSICDKCFHLRVLSVLLWADAIGIGKLLLSVMALRARGRRMNGALVCMDALNTEQLLSCARLSFVSVVTPGVRFARPSYVCARA